MQKVKEYRWYIIFLCALIAFTFITDFNGLYGQDSYEYLRYTNSLSLFLKTGTNPGGFFWPLLYPLCGALLSFVIKPILAMQIISMISFVGAAVYLKKIILFLYKPCNEIADAFIFLIFLLSPYMLRASIVVMSEMLSVFFLMGAFYSFLKYRDSFNVRYFISFVAFSVASVSTRYTEFFLLLIPACVMGYSFVKNFNWIVFLASIAITVVIALPHLILRFHQPLAFMNNELLDRWSVANFFKNDFNTIDGYAHNKLINIIYSLFNFFHPAFCFVGIVLLFISVKYYKRLFTKGDYVIAASVLVYIVFLAGIPFQDLRFLLLSFPLIAILFFPAFKYLIDYLTEVRKLGDRKIYALYILIAIVQLGLFCRVFVPFYHYNKIEKQIANQVLQYPGRPIYTFSIDGALKAYGVKNRIINLYMVKLDTMTAIAGEKLALFNEAQFAEEWKGKNPINNWEYIKKNFKLNKIEDLPDGWRLYEIL